MLANIWCLCQMILGIPTKWTHKFELLLTGDYFFPLVFYILVLKDCFILEDSFSCLSNLFFGWIGPWKICLEVLYLIQIWMIFKYTIAFFLCWVKTFICSSETNLVYGNVVHLLFITLKTCSHLCIASLFANSRTIFITHLSSTYRL